MGSADSIDGKENESDKFGYYSRAVAELLAEENDDKDDDSKKLNGSFGSIPLFDKALESGFSKLKSERLKMLLRQSIFDLTPRVDEMFEPVLNMNKLQLQLRSKKQQENHVDSASDAVNSGRPPKKRKFAYSTYTACDSTEEHAANDVANGEVNEDLRLLLNNDSSNVEAILKKYTDELSATLESMKLRLEEVLDQVMSKCRPMSSAEKQKLKRLLQDLPEESLVRVVDILKCSGMPRDQIFFDFKKVDNATLWQLYYYVEAFQKEKTHLLSIDL